jgi:glycosidase
VRARPHALLLLALGLACASPAPRLSGSGAALQPRADLRGAVVYGVVPPLFGARPLASVTARLDALAELGVDVLWLSPVMDTDDRGAISYATTDYERVRPDYGTPDELRALVREAHARGMRVVLDIVPNHTSVGHPWYADAAARGRESPHWSWYVRDANGVAQHDFDWAHLKKLDYANAAVRRAIEAAFLHWLRAYGVDGFRVDAAWGIRERAPDFWPELVRALRRERPDAILIAEASARDPYWVANGFDAAYDWSEDLGHWSWDALFDDPRRIGPALDGALASEATPMNRVLRFIDNNDTGDRFVTRHGPARTRQAAVLVHALPGLAEVFTGEELGAEYRPYDDPPPVRWSLDPANLRPLYRRLAELRERLPALRQGGYRRVRTAGTDSAFAFLRDAGDEGQALVVLNFGPARTLRLEAPVDLARAPAWDAISERRIEVRALGLRTLEAALPADGAVILVP